jgi:hypothetical protein
MATIESYDDDKILPRADKNCHAADFGQEAVFVMNATFSLDLIFRSIL